jgi:hypothetical protein
MRELRNYIFLTGGEAEIHSTMFLTTHLRPGDPRNQMLRRLALPGIADLTPDPIHLVLHNPRIKQSWYFMRDTWYLVPHVRYTGRSTSRGVDNMSFKYNYGGPSAAYPREMSAEEVDFFRDKNHLQKA